MPRTTQAVDSAPVEAVGESKERGVWPSEVSEIARDERLTRPVELSDGTVSDQDVVVTDIQQILRDDGTETDGYAVSYQFEDPTLGGDS